MKAFEIFTAELSTAFKVISDLRDLSRQAISQDERHKIEELLLKVVQTTADNYHLTRNYSIECAQIRGETLRNSEVVVTEETQAKILFEENLGPIIREFSVPITALKGYFELIQLHAPAEDQKQECLKTCDKIIECILELLILCQKHLRGEINLWEYKWEET